MAIALTATFALVACVAPPPVSETPRAAQSQLTSPGASVDRAFGLPATGPVIAGFDGQRNKGVDFAGKRGDPVVAAGDGRVVYAGGGLRGYGQLIIVKHDDVYLTAYAHNDALLVREGDSVLQGQTIGRMGSTDADRVKLHFEVRRKGVSVDPNPYLYQAKTASRDTTPAAKVPAVLPTAASEGPSTGSSFSVTDKYLVTNAHVVTGCKTITVDERGSARVRAIDKTNDLALIEVASQPGLARLREGRLRQGEPVTVIGFPFAGILGDGPQVTAGNVTALSGMGSDTRFIQISAAVQPGNSGGPVLDQSGNVIGVVASKLGLKFAAVTGDLPQNLNFAISLDALRGFLNASGVKYNSAPLGRALSTADVADIAKPFTSLVRCST